MDPQKQIEGFFIQFEGDEIRDIKEELIRQGYTPDGAGIKEALLDSLFAVEGESEAVEGEMETERIIRKARKFVEENPATIKFGMDTISRLAMMMAKKARR